MLCDRDSNNLTIQNLLTTPPFKYTSSRHTPRIQISLFQPSPSSSMNYHITYKKQTMISILPLQNSLSKAALKQIFSHPHFLSKMLWWSTFLRINLTIDKFYCSRFPVKTTQNHFQDCLRADFWEAVVYFFFIRWMVVQSKLWSSHAQNSNHEWVVVMRAAMCLSNRMQIQSRWRHF